MGEPTGAIAWCVWTAFATLAGLGVIRPLKMLSILLLEIFYKILWLLIVAYPLGSRGTLIGSPAEEVTSKLLWVILPIIAVSWGYVFVNYVSELQLSQPFLVLPCRGLGCPISRGFSRDVGNSRTLPEQSLR
jgi:hypothetical protein